MRMTMSARKEIGKVTRRRYQKASKAEKSRILDEVCAMTGWHRKHAIRVLNEPVPPPAKRGSKVIAKPKETRGRKPVYTDEALAALRKIWAVLDCPCGKRLAPAMGDTIDAMERHGELAIARETRDKLLSISPSTCDRLLAADRKKVFGPRGMSATKPGTLLRSQIPVRTFADWDEQAVGFMEIDLVAHCGASTGGERVNTLDMTDVASGWTETRAVVNKASVHVKAAVEDVRRQLPFPLLGIDPDNGSEFINGILFRYCRDERVTFTRSRPDKKNDCCYVEGKNWHVVRKLIGYDRYEGWEAVDLLNEVYARLRLFTNFFSPQQKLLEKARDGAKVKKRHDEAKTPYRRIMEDENVEAGIKARLERQYLSLNPATIRKETLELVQDLRKLAVRPPRGGGVVG